MTSRWKALNWFVLTWYLLSAAVQYNDPDPLRWIAIYLVASACCVLHGLGRPVWKVPALLSVGALVWALVLLPDVIGKTTWGEMTESWVMSHDRPNSINTEEGREMGGLVLILFWMVPQTVVGWRRRAQVTA